MKSRTTNCFVLAVLLHGIACAALAQPVNSWTNASSGSWEDLKWSLGTRPSANHSVMITNAGWKAVALNPSTIATHPETLTVSNLTISAPTDSMNTLLLNYAGIASPLRVGESLIVGPNGTLSLLSSALVGAGRFVITNGSVDVHSSYLYITNDLYTPDTKLAGAQMSLIDSDTRFGGMQVGIAAPSLITQINGTNRCSGLFLGTYDFSTGGIASRGEYSLTNGLLQMNYAEVGYMAEGSFSQSGGAVSVNSMEIGFGDAGGAGGYSLYSGSLTCSELTVGSHSGIGSFLQANGTNRTTSLKLGSSGNPLAYPQSASYILLNGVLATASTTLGSVLGQCGLGQSGGTFLVTNALSVSGSSGYHSIHEKYFAGYSISAGTCSVGTLQINNMASFYQTGGVFSVQGAANFDGYAHIDGPVTYGFFQGGRFSCSSLNSDETEISLTGGHLIISNLLSFSGLSSYCPCIAPRGLATFSFTNGFLTASNIFIQARMNLSTSTPGHISNPGSFTFSGFLFCNGCDEQLGRFVLLAHTFPNPGKPLIDLGTGINHLRFADSSAESWSAGELLMITNWSGSIDGGGADQLKFGTTATGLTAAQLDQIQFVNPDGFPPGTYNAKILSTGEVVPVFQSTLFQSVVGSKVILAWSNATTLQTSTNVQGPFEDVLGAASPFTNQLPPTPARFFRLRQ